MADIFTVNGGPSYQVHLIILLTMTSYASTGTMATSDGDLRLVDGSLPNLGKLEMYYEGQWGTICSDGFGISEANVACTQLGYELAYDSIDGTYYEEGSILLGDVFCWGYESRLIECYHSAWNYTNCVHSEVIGVNCSSGGDNGLSTTHIAAIAFVVLLITVAVSSGLWVTVKDRNRNSNRRSASSDTNTSSVNCGLNLQQQHELYGPCSVLSIPRLPAYTETNEPPSYEASVAASSAEQDGVTNRAFESEGCGTNRSFQTEAQTTTSESTCDNNNNNNDFSNNTELY